MPGLGEHFTAVDLAVFERAFLSDKKHGANALALVLPVHDPEDDLPLTLCRLPREAATVAAVVAAVERTQGTFA